MGNDIGAIRDMREVPGTARDNRALDVFGRIGEAKRKKEAVDLGLGDNIAELDEVGFTIVPPDRMNTGDLVRRLLARLSELAADANGGIGPDLATGDSHASMVNPSGQELYYLMARGRPFEEALMHPIVLALASYLIGDSVVLSSARSMIKGPGKLPRQLHCDQPIHPTPTSFVANCTYALTDYSRENGGLCIVPGSHRYMRQPTAEEKFSVTGGSITTRDRRTLVELDDVRDVVVDDAPNIVAVEAPAGSLLVWHGNLWHGAFARTSPGLRVSLLLFFCHSYLRPQEPYRELIPQEILDRNNDRFAELIGRKVHYGWQEEGPEYEPGRAFARHRDRASNTHVPR